LLINIRTMGPRMRGWSSMAVAPSNFCTNNYLGLANHPKMKAAAQAAIERWGVGPAAVRSIAGTQGLHLELERRIAAFKGVEDALYVQSGFCANQAAIPPLVGKEDVIFSDRLNHASIIDGARLSSAKIIVYEHCDPADARSESEHLPQYRRSLLVTDSVFSMDGDMAPLDKLTVADRYGVLTMVTRMVRVCGTWRPWRCRPFGLQGVRRGDQHLNCIWGGRRRDRGQKASSITSQRPALPVLESDTQPTQQLAWPRSTCWRSKVGQTRRITRRTSRSR
jgi:hypothetical protein